MPAARPVRWWACAAAVCGVATSLRAQAITLDDVVRSAAIASSAPAAVAWSPDGTTLAFTWDSSGGRTRDVWLADRDGRNRRQLTEFNVMPGRGGARELVWLPNSQQVAVLRGAALLLIDATTQAERTVASVGPEAGELRVSPRGDRAAYLHRGDVWIVPFDSGALPRQVTFVGLPSLSPSGIGTYARAEREIGSATWGSGAPNLSWSPDGRWLALHLVDRRGVRTVPFPDYLAAETTPNVMRRSYPGDANELRKVVLLNVDSGDTTVVPFPRPDAVQVANMAWSSRGELLVDRESDDATERWVHVVTPGAAPRQVYSDRRDSRIYSEFGSVWSADGRTVLLTTDRDDRYRVFALTPGDSTLTALTPPDMDVQGAAMPLPDGGIAWIASSLTPADRQLWRDSRAGAAVRLTNIAGTHRPVVSPDGATVATLVSNDVTPPMLVVERSAARDMQVVVDAPWSRLPATRIVAPRYAMVPGAVAGESLAVKVWLPRAADSGQRVPVLFGPIYSNTVRDRWGGTYGMLQQHLVQKGYAVIQVDVRGSTGYGRAFREAFLFEWGGRDLDDLAAAKQWLGSQPWADTTRTGVFGSSYGGLITVYALFRRPGLFKAGVAGAAAIDPRFFGSDDVAITRRPNTHPEAFTRGALQYAGGLQDHLMMIHGMLDDVVPFKTTAVLAEELMRLGKDFDLVVAPGATHGWTARPQHARYLLGKLVQHFDRHIGSAPAPVVPPAAISRPTAAPANAPAARTRRSLTAPRRPARPD
jgi:dipeptidyl-peptidase 4